MGQRVGFGEPFLVWVRIVASGFPEELDKLGHGFPLNHILRIRRLSRAAEPLALRYTLRTAE